MQGVNNSFFHNIEALERDIERLGRREDTTDLNDRVTIAFATLDANAGFWGDYQSDAIRARLERMQRKLASVKLPVNMVTVEAVRKTFYNLMVEVALQMPNLQRQDQLVRLVARTLVAAVDQSRDMPGIPCATGQMLNLDNCPDLFLPLLQVVLMNKKPITLLSQAQLADLNETLVSDGPKSNLAQELLSVALKISQGEVFQRLGAEALGFCADCKAENPAAQIDSIIVPPVWLEGVTEELVRDSFYNLMADHAATTGLITKEALDIQESYIYFALSHHALIEAMCLSRAYKDVILVANNKALNLNNCPAKYKEFAEVIFKFKAAVCKLTPEELQVIKTYSVDEPDLKLPEELEKLKTPALLAIAANLHRVAQHISELDTFKQIISGVIEFLSDAKGKDLLNA